MNIEKIEPLNKNIFLEKSKLEEKLNPINALIEDRIDYIIRKVFEARGITNINYNWWIDEAGEGEVGNIMSLLYRDFIAISTINTSGTKGSLKYHTAILSNEAWNIGESVPIDWLYKDFENELIEGIELSYKKKAEKLKEEINKREIKKNKREELLKSAKSKLSKEEIKALNLG